MTVVSEYRVVECTTQHDHAAFQALRYNHPWTITYHSLFISNGLRFSVYEFSHVFTSSLQCIEARVHTMHWFPCYLCARSTDQLSRNKWVSHSLRIRHRPSPSDTLPILRLHCTEKGN